MGAAFNVKHGAQVRYTLPLDSGETTAFKKGRVMQMSSTGTMKLHDGTSLTLLTGIVMENRVVNQVGVTTSKVVTGAPTGDRYSMIIDKAVIIDDEIRSGINFEPGNVVYTDTTGQLTTSGNGTGPASPKLGIAASQGRSGDGARPLEFYFDVSY